MHLPFNYSPAFESSLLIPTKVIPCEYKFLFALLLQYIQWPPVSLEHTSSLPGHCALQEYKINSVSLSYWVCLASMSLPILSPLPVFSWLFWTRLLRISWCTPHSGCPSSLLPPTLLLPSFLPLSLSFFPSFLKFIYLFWETESKGTHMQACAWVGGGRGRESITSKVPSVCGARQGTWSHDQRSWTEQKPRLGLRADWATHVSLISNSLFNLLSHTYFWSNNLKKIGFSQTWSWKKIDILIVSEFYGPHVGNPCSKGCWQPQMKKIKSLFIQILTCRDLGFSSYSFTLTEKFNLELKWCDRK